MEQTWQSSFQHGLIKSIPLVFSAAFFGLIFGFTGASGGFSLVFTSAMSYIIFAGSAQFITLVLLIQGEELVAIVIAAIILNLRHLLYGAVLHDLLEFKGLKRLIPAYFLTDEAFLVTTLVNKEMKEEPELTYRLDFVLLGAGMTLWFFWNLTTILGHLLFQLSEDILLLPDNFVISASFLGFLLEHWIKFPKDRFVIVVSSLLSISLGFFVSSSTILIAVMLGGAISAMFLQLWRSKNV